MTLRPRTAQAVIFTAVLLCAMAGASADWGASFSPRGAGGPAANDCGECHEGFLAFDMDLEAPSTVDSGDSLVLRCVVSNKGGPDHDLTDVRAVLVLGPDALVELEEDDAAQKSAARIGPGDSAAFTWRLRAGDDDGIQKLTVTVSATAVAGNDHPDPEDDTADYIYEDSLSVSVGGALGAGASGLDTSFLPLLGAVFALAALLFGGQADVWPMPGMGLRGRDRDGRSRRGAKPRVMELVPGRDRDVPEDDGPAEGGDAGMSAGSRRLASTTAAGLVLAIGIMMLYSSRVAALLREGEGALSAGVLGFMCLAFALSSLRPVMPETYWRWWRRRTSLWLAVGITVLGTEHALLFGVDLDPATVSWYSARALGFTSLSLLLWSASAGAMGDSMKKTMDGLYGSRRKRTRAHHFVSYLLLAVSLVHGLMLVTGFYAGAPEMWALGIVTWCTITALALHGIFEKALKATRGSEGWTTQHRVLSIAGLALVMVHMVYSGSTLGLRP